MIYFINFVDILNLEDLEADDGESNENDVNGREDRREEYCNLMRYFCNDPYQFHYQFTYGLLTLILLDG